MCFLCDQATLVPGIHPHGIVKSDGILSFWEGLEAPVLLQLSGAILLCFLVHQPDWMGWGILGEANFVCDYFPFSDAGSDFSCFPFIFSLFSLGSAAVYVSILGVRYPLQFSAHTWRVRVWGKANSEMVRDGSLDPVSQCSAWQKQLLRHSCRPSMHCLCPAPCPAPWVPLRGICLSFWQDYLRLLKTMKLSCCCSPFPFALWEVLGLFSTAFSFVSAFLCRAPK